ncbi:MAG: hypothetical protein AVDCRST_MAG66-733 [uncultured Pseudonocardia sp.]|uniref:Uncharacterized protein n=1 Tax=uncultured Pseudonocardia sp. TaxID=211455 RepID=A0A6J4NNZ7_9PSEU|nr:MAG: hypothetical protein AVDCRST_MAG66-733 [uncultured Pseudonocardia sp.]
MPLMNRLKSFLNSPQGRRTVESAGRAAAGRSGRTGRRPSRGGGLLSRFLGSRRGI